MNEVEKKQVILDFLQTQKLGVLSTINAEGRPESAAVGFSEKQDLQMIFGTQTSTRKYSNLLKNPYIAFTFFENKTTVQYEAVARLLEGEERKKCREIHLSKIPGAAKFADLPDEVYFLATPSWIRYTSFASDGEGIFELTF